jgi:hypothetical protein
MLHSTHTNLSIHQETEQCALQEQPGSEEETMPAVVACGAHHTTAISRKVCGILRILLPVVHVQSCE